MHVYKTIIGKTIRIPYRPICVNTMCTYYTVTWPMTWYTMDSEYPISVNIVTFCSKINEVVYLLTGLNAIGIWCLIGHRIMLSFKTSVLHYILIMQLFPSIYFASLTLSILPLGLSCREFLGKIYKHRINNWAIE